MQTGSAPQSELLTRAFWPVVILLLAYLAVVQVRSALLESVTGDEPTELAAGYSYLKTGDFRMNPEHPPLAKIIAALPLLHVHLTALWDSRSWRAGDEAAFGAEWLNVNAGVADQCVFDGRMTSIVMTLCLGLVIACWTRSVFGVPGAFLAVTLYAFDPTVTAYGRYVKNDLPVALFAFSAVIAWTAWLKRPDAPRLLNAGLLLGLALATKFSAFFLIPVFALLWAMKPTSRSILALVSVLVIAAATIALVYEIPAILHGRSVPGLDRQVIHDLMDRSVTGVFSRPGGGVLHEHPLFAGLVSFLDHNTIGHRAYLLGEVRIRGWWYYFPVAFAVKTPVATLAIVVLAFVVAIHRLVRGLPKHIPMEWYAVSVPPAIFATLSLASRIDVGVRHLLPAFPFLFVLVAGAITRSSRRVMTIAAFLCVCVAAESIAVYPDYTAFFNFFAGGPANGPRILADSNIDWGQDANKLARWVREHRPVKLCLDYWGSADLSRLGLAAPSLVTGWEKAGVIPGDCIAAVSTNILHGLQPGRGEFGWLLDKPPLARIGYSIYLFDLPQLIRHSPSIDVSPAFVSVMHGDFRGTPTPKDPATPGELLALFMTGLGPVEAAVAAGRPAPTSRLIQTQYPIVCRWDNADTGPLVEVSFAGLAPGKVGTYQLNVRVPPSIKTGTIACRPALFSLTRAPAASVAVPVSAARY